MIVFELAQALIPVAKCDILSYRAIVILGQHNVLTHGMLFTLNQVHKEGEGLEGILCYNISHMLAVRRLLTSEAQCS